MTGFNSKREAAADKLQEPVCDKDPQGCWNVRCQLGKQCKNLAQPAQEPVVDKGFPWTQKHVATPQVFGAMPSNIPQPQRPWVGLTETERNDLEDYCEMIIGKAAFDAIEAKLKERNHGT